MQMNANRNVLPVFHLVVDEIETLDMLDHLQVAFKIMMNAMNSFKC